MTTPSLSHRPAAGEVAWKVVDAFGEDGPARAHPRGDERRGGLLGRRRAPVRRGLRGRRRTLHLWDYPEDARLAQRGHGRCCAPEDQYDARRVADALGFAHFTFDRRALFERTVVEPFVDAYLAGETPSPCTACNRGVKLAELFALADRLGAAHVATGHYARVVRDAGGAPRLATGKDAAKDQSYFLYASPRAWLERLVFPLGESTKAEVRGEAVARGLPGAGKGESQELCFVGAGPHAYADFVGERAAGRVRPGPSSTTRAGTVGAHDGVHRFTVGQRKGPRRRPWHGRRS